MTPRIFGFGSVAVDFRIRTGELGVGYTGKLLAQEIMPSPGGATANALTQAARLGADTALIAKLGHDIIGRQIKDSLYQENIGTSCLIIDPTLSSPFNVAVYAGHGMRRIGGYLLPNSLARWTEEELTYTAGQMAPGDLLLVEIGEIPLPLTLCMCRLAKEKGVRILIDVDLDPCEQCGGQLDDIKAIFALADVLMPNVEAMATLYGSAPAADIVRDLAVRYNTTVIMTQGAAGSLLCRPDGTTTVCPAFPVEATDTVGAGDAFHGSFAFAFSRGAATEDAIAFASWCAAQNCLAFGATAGMPRIHDVVTSPQGSAFHYLFKQ